eukprot:4641081-Prymnesium_polylepis.1
MVARELWHTLGKEARTEALATMLAADTCREQLCDRVRRRGAGRVFIAVFTTLVTVALPLLHPLACDLRDQQRQQIQLQPGV